MNDIKPRYDFIDFAKAIAISLMVLLHTTFSYPVLGSFIGAFHMAIFFFIAGMFAKGAETPAKIIAKKGFQQLIIPYFCLSILSFSSCWISPYLHPELYPGFNGFASIFKGAFIGMLLMQDRVTSYSFLPCGPLWFLPALFLCRIFFMVWIKSGSKKFYIIRFLIIAALTTIYIFDISLFSLSSAAVSFPFFLVGYYLRTFTLQHSLSHKSTSIYTLIAILSFIAVHLLYGHGVNFDGGNYTGYILIAYIRGFIGIIGLLSLVLIIAKLNIPKTHKTLTSIGQATIAILGLHGYFIIAFKVIYVLTGHNADFIPVSIAIPVSIVIVLICTYIYQTFLIRYTPFIVGKSIRKDTSMPLSI